VRTIQTPVCPICGQPQASEKYCRDCQESPPHFNALRSWAIYGGPVRQAIHGLKYKRNIALGEIFGRRLIGVLSQTTWGVNLVIPVPLGIARLAERGYNQASLLARPVALGLGLAFCPQGLSRARETRSQVDLNSSERKVNVAGAFQAIPRLIQSKRVLLVDDVATTGATLDACATALLAGGADSVYALTLARTSVKD
jgi:ComF family protein